MNICNNLSVLQKKKQSYGLKQHDFVINDELLNKYE